jgi:hypothetical protein
MVRSSSVSVLLLAAVATVSAVSNSTDGTYDVLDYVNQLIGSDNGGKTGDSTSTEKSLII